MKNAPGVCRVSRERHVLVDESVCVVCGDKFTLGPYFTDKDVIKVTSTLMPMYKQMICPIQLYGCAVISTMSPECCDFMLSMIKANRMLFLTYWVGQELAWCFNPFDMMAFWAGFDAILINSKANDCGIYFGKLWDAMEREGKV